MSVRTFCRTIEWHCFHGPTIIEPTHVRKKYFQRPSLKRIVFRWLYRKHPSVCHKPFSKIHHRIDTSEFIYTPEALRYNPIDIPDAKERKVNFIEGLLPVASNGNPMQKNGVGIYVFALNQSMERNSSFYNSDGDFLIGN